MTWGRKTGGRQKGTKNKKTRKLEAATAKDGISPLDYLLSVMRDGAAARHERRDRSKIDENRGGRLAGDKRARKTLCQSSKNR
jgi:hypothetical protein